MRHVILASSLFAVAALASVEAGKGPARASKPLLVQATAATSAPQSRLEADEALDGAVAAAVIGAITHDFGEQQVGVKLDRVQVEPASIRDRAVSGEGRLQLGGEQEWIDFRFAAQYDTQTATVLHPQLVIGATGTGREVGLDAPMSAALERRVTRDLRGEFAEQPVSLSFDRVRAIDAGARYLRVEAIGLADFGAEGTTPASAQGLYDQRTGTWLKVSYELGSTANWAETQLAAL